MIRITGEDRIRLLATMAVEIFKRLPDRENDLPLAQDLTHRANLAVGTAWEMLEDIQNRTNGR
jgi:hypothetical protein